jgi:hypothetical protein
MSVCVVLFPTCQQPVAGATVPDIGLGEEDEERIATEQKDAAALSKRLSTIMAGLQNDQQNPDAEGGP